MGRCELLAVFVIALVLAISLQQAYALKCWNCASHNKRVQNPGCMEIFDEKSLTDHDKKDVTYSKECTNKADHITYCRKFTQIVDNETRYQRTCYWKSVNASADQCYDDEPLPSFVKNVNCQLCDSDGCNGVNDATQFGPIALLSIIPVVVARSFLL